MNGLSGYIKMPYIGRPQESGAYRKLDDISSQFNGSLVTFNLSIGGLPFFCQNSYSVLVSLEGVIQEPIKSYTITENQITFADAPKTNDAFYAVVLSTTTTTPSLTGLTIGRRTGATTIDLHGEHLGVLKRDGTKGFIAFNQA